MLHSEQPSTNNAAILPIWMWKPNKKIERYSLLKTEFLSGGHFVFNFFGNNILFGAGSIAQHEKWQRQARVASCPQPRVLGSKQVLLWCGAEPIQEEEAKTLNEGWAHKSVLFLIKMWFQALRFQGFALVFIFLRSAQAIFTCLALGVN